MTHSILCHEADQIIKSDAFRSMQRRRRRMKVTMGHIATAFPQTWLKAKTTCSFALMKDHVKKWQTVSTVGELGQQFIYGQRYHSRITWVPHEVRQWSANACSSVGWGVKQPLTQHQFFTDLSPWLGNVSATRQMHSPMHVQQSRVGTLQRML